MDQEDYSDEELRQKSEALNRAAVEEGLTGRTSIPNTATESDRKKAMERVFGDN
jgi:hypothetical protein